MAAASVHLSQAEHNREVARHLLDTPPRHDWAITAAFYSAIHYFESWLFDQPEAHTETSIPTGSDGRLRYTAHAWREQLVRTKLSKDSFKSYQQLHHASETAR